MQRGAFVLPIMIIATVVSLLSSADSAFAANVNVDIPVGAIDPNCFLTPDTCYDPSDVTVNQYDTITWVNQDSTDHTSTSGTPDNWTGLWNTGNIPPTTSSVPIEMSVSGTFQYHCAIHPWQVGTVTVLPAINPVSIPLNAGDPNCALSPDACYDPDTITVVQGEIVEWTNNDVAPEGHTSTSDDGFWHSGQMANGETFQLDTSSLDPGSYPYHCQIHPWQTGTLNVDAPTTYYTVEIPEDSSLPGYADPSSDCTAQGPNACYNPDSLTVKLGDVITWNNNDPAIIHTVTSDDGTSWDSGDMFPAGITQGFILDTTSMSVGNYPYHCSIHPWQVGQITILDNLNFDPIPEKIPKGTITVDLQPFVTDLISPVHLTHNGDDSGDVYIVDQPGIIYRADSSGVLQPTPFLDISSQVYMPGFFGTQNEGDFDERGLLGLAFHPQYNSPSAPGEGILYTYHSAAYPGSGIADFQIPMTGTPDNIVVVTEWKVDLATIGTGTVIVDPTSERVIMTVEEPQFNHEGGMLGFNPTEPNNLYISFGDGGAANDNADGHTPVTGNGQDESNLLGSIVRIDPLCLGGGAVSANGEYCIPPSNPNVGVGGELDEIYAHGLRNNWRFSWDPASGLMYGADVGQNQIEEINIITQGGNYGWNDREGTFGFDENSALINNSPTPLGMTDPIAQYDHDEGISITGGYVYRGSTISQLQGMYVFGDFSTGFFAPDGRLFYLDTEGILSEIFELKLSGGDPPVGLFVKSFGEDQSGELYVLAGTNLGPFETSGGQALGQVLKIIPDTGGGPTGQAEGQVEILAAPTCGISFVSGTPINFGSLIPGQESNQQTLTIDNTGDVFATLLVRGGDWVDEELNPQMVVGDTHYSSNIADPYPAMTELDYSDQILNPTFDPNFNFDTYWTLLANIIGSFQGTLTQTIDFTVAC